MGPYQPSNITFPRKKFGSSQRQFQANWYTKFQWLEYSPVLDAAFCFPCRCFAREVSTHRGHSDSAYTKNGFNNWNIATQKFKLHQQSSIHLGSESSLNQYLKNQPIDIILQTERSLNLSRQEEIRLKNRSFMKRFIDIIITITKGGRALRGHDEKEESNERGLFLEIVDLHSRYDPVLKEHLKNGPKNATYLSHQIQNDILQSIHNVMFRSIVSTIHKKQVSIIADDTTDLGHNEQMSIVIRYFDDDLFAPNECFIGLRRLLLVDAQSIFNELSHVMDNLSIEWTDIVAVCFDGASTMSGYLSGVQAKFKEKNSKILYVHCYAHCLNLLLVDACTSSKDNKIVFDFFGIIQLTYSFIEGSAVRHAVLEKISSETNISLKTLKSLSNTRWACRAEAVTAIKHNYLALIPALEEIINLSKLPEVCAKGRGLLFQIRSFNFIFGLEMMDPVLRLINKVSKILQSEDNDLLSAMNNINSLQSSFQEMRNEEYFSTIFKKSTEISEALGIPFPLVKKRKVSSRIDNNTTQVYEETKEQELRIKSFYPMLDLIINGINERFSQETMNIINAIDKLLKLNITRTDIYFLSDHFQCNRNELETEVQLLKNNDTIKINSLHDWLQWFKISNHKLYFSNFFQVIQRFMVIPVTSCTCERSFSKLSVVKSKLRTTMRQDRLNTLMLLSVERELAVKIDTDEVINDFKNKVEFKRRMIL